MPFCAWSQTVHNPIRHMEDCDITQFRNICFHPYCVLMVYPVMFSGFIYCMQRALRKPDPRLFPVFAVIWFQEYPTNEKLYVLHRDQEKSGQAGDKSKTRWFGHAKQVKGQSCWPVLQHGSPLTVWKTAEHRGGDISNYRKTATKPGLRGSWTWMPCKSII